MFSAWMSELALVPDSVAYTTLWVKHEVAARCSQSRVIQQRPARGWTGVSVPHEAQTGLDSHASLLAFTQRVFASKERWEVYDFFL